MSTAEAALKNLIETLDRVGWEGHSIAEEGELDKAIDRGRAACGLSTEIDNKIAELEKQIADLHKAKSERGY